MCAIEAGKRGRRVALLDHADRVGKKILISGGGRCNFTNIHCKPENFLSANPHFARSALARYTPADFIALVEKHGIRLSREDARPALLRWLREGDCGHAARRVCRSRSGDIPQRTRAQRFARDDDFCVVTQNEEFHGTRAGRRDRRVVDSEDGRDFARLRDRGAIRNRDSGMPPRVGAVGSRSSGPTGIGAIWPGFRPKWLPRPGGRSFARSCSSPIAD